MKLSLVFGLAFVTACAHEASHHDEFPIGMTHTTAVDEPQTEPGLSPNLRISAELMRKCQVHFDNVEDAPRFWFDRAALDPQDQAILAQVAKCVTDGPLAGHSLQLVGRADERGEAEYNMSLGARRSDAAQQFLVRVGLAPTRIRSTSRGQLDATGKDESTWALDRRVDIDLQ
ncbi:MAG TPA: OmpA family protein [Polyangiaceae bacterium]